MPYSEQFSKTLNRKIQVDQIIDKMQNPQFANQIRLNSMAQKLRKKSLSTLFDNKNKINKNHIKSFCNLLKLNELTLEEYLNYNFAKFNENLKLVNSSIAKTDNSKCTKISREIISLVENNNFKYLSLIIHGSQANGETTNFSDIDISVFIKTNLINDIKKLKKVFFQINLINKKIAFHDPVSHHSIFINLLNDLDCYPESFMPIAVLNKGCVPNNHEIAIKSTRYDLDLKVENFFNIFVSMIELDNRNGLNNLFNIKFFLSSYFMLIILEYEILFEKYSDKKDIFQNQIFKYKTKKSIEVLIQASNIRRDWPEIIISNVRISNDFVEKIILDSYEMSQNIQNKKILTKIEKNYLIL